MTLALDYIRTRSVKIKSVQFLTGDTVKFTIKSWQGDYYTPAGVEKSVTKQKIGPSQASAYFDPSIFVKDVDLEGVVPNYAGLTEVINIPSCKWAQITSSVYTLGVTQSTITNMYYVTDGYTSIVKGTMDEHTLPDLLLTGDKRRHASNMQGRVHFKAEGLLGITRVTQDGTSHTVSQTATVTQSYQFYQAVRYDKLTKSLTFQYATGSKTVNFEWYDECKYPQWSVIFKNKYGVLETLSMSKVSKKSVTVEKDNFNRSIIDANGYYDITRHSNKDKIASGKDGYILNSELLKDYENDIYEELFLSEDVWLQEPGGEPFPVTLGDSKFDRKTILNDKTIQYSITFKSSHNKIRLS